MRKNISVSDPEIAIAQRGVTTSCAIAAAIMTQVPTARRINVNKDEISWLDVSRNLRLVFRTPKSAQVFIENWDNGEPCRPFAFSLTDSQLIATRVPRPKSTEARIKASGKPLAPTKNPGKLRRRTPDESCEQMGVE
jgi:hypothetical protein